MTALAIRNDATRSVTWTPAAHELIESALAVSALIGKVTTPEENAEAVEAQKAVRAAKFEIEKVRKVLKEPILEFGREIDATAKRIAAPLEPEEIRLATIVGDYQQIQEAKRKAAEAARLLELQKIETERRAEMVRVAREEAARREEMAEIEREVARQAAAARTAEETARAAALQAEIDRQKAIADTDSFDAMNALQEKFNAAAASVEAPASPVRATGQVVREDWEIEEIDLWKLAKSRPDLVRIEADRVAIKAELNTGVALPGVKARKVIKASVRSGRSDIVNI